MIFVKGHMITKIRYGCNVLCSKSSSQKKRGVFMKILIFENWDSCLHLQVELQKSLRDLEAKETALKDSMFSLKEKEAELSHCQEGIEKSQQMRRSRSASPNRPR